MKFGNEVTYFYKTPSREKFNSILSFVENDFPRIKAKNERLNLSITTAAFLAAASNKYGWRITGSNKASMLGREILEGKSDFAKFVNDNNRVAPVKLDIWWSSFFATGDNRFLEKILQFAGEKMPERGNSQYGMIGSASWSFKSNCAQHDAVKSYARNCLTKKQYAEKTQYLTECINQ